LKIKKKKISLEITGSKHIVCNLKINNKRARFLVDTGASNSCFDILKKEKYNIQSKGKEIELTSAAEKKMGAICSDNCKLTLNPHKGLDVTLMLIEMSTINGALKEQKEKKIDGILGGDILNEIKAKINYKNLSIEFV
jgi:hypothetical protein|tara:strand:- start:1132 stop:1545 length:414 start_codon:yes stop_codon:yes gene_type:complete